MTSILVVAKTPSTPAKTAQAAPIPFRESSPTSTPQVVGLLTTTLLLLGIFYAVAWYARKAGWLDRWIGPRPQAGDKTRQLAVLERLMISRKTTLYRVRHGDREFLLAESSTPVHLSEVTVPHP